MDHLALNSITAVAAETRVNPPLPATAVVEFIAKWSNLCPRTVVRIFQIRHVTKRNCDKIVQKIPLILVFFSAVVVSEHSEGEQQSGRDGKLDGGWGA